MQNNSEANACEKCPRCGASQDGHTYKYEKRFTCGTVFVAADGGRWLVRILANDCRIRELAAERDAATSRAEQAEREAEELRGVLEDFKAVTNCKMFWHIHEQIVAALALVTAKINDAGHIHQRDDHDQGRCNLCKAESTLAALAALEPRNGREGE